MGTCKNVDEIKTLLSSKKTTDVRKAAKFLQKNLMPELEDFVIDALQNELLRNQKSWETKCELIHCIGINDYKKATPFLEQIAEINEEFDTITNVAGRALIRVKRKDKSDVSELLKRLSTMGYSLGYGMLDALGYDKMQPNNEDIKTIIDAVWDFGKNIGKGFCDPRYGLVAACAGWEPSLVRDFLLHCIATGDVPVKYVAENSLKGKYVRLR